jgi:hypothetical protein
MKRSKAILCTSLHARARQALPSSSPHHQAAPALRAPAVINLPIDSLTEEQRPLSSLLASHMLKLVKKPISFPGMTGRACARIVSQAGMHVVL